MCKGLCLVEAERPSADEMDEQRREQMAYEYLLRLEEARGSAIINLIIWLAGMRNF